MSRLFSYTIPVDDGAAPNPFNGICTLAICKPAIRRNAKVGDWVAGLGSTNAPSGDLSGKLVYAMRVDEVLTMREYDEHSDQRWPFRVPDTNSLHLPDRLGDCIYDYSSGSPKLRSSVHGEENMKTDLGGEKVLISKEFYYFGHKAIRLPKSLTNICHQTQGHKSNSNSQYLEPFKTWIRSLGFQVGIMHGWPDTIVDWDERSSCSPCNIRIQAANQDC